MTTHPRILYCHCAYAQVVPKAVKEEVLRQLAASGVAFDSVADLCEMSARGDAALKQLAEGGEVKIAACYPRAVKWLFAAAGAPLPAEGVEILNMRVESAEDVVHSLLGTGEASLEKTP
jgi:heterodisulfide reductase subunit A-like polyferredoxin